MRFARVSKCFLGILIVLITITIIFSCSMLKLKQTNQNQNKESQLTPIPVTSITVTGAGSATTVANGGTLAMSAAVLPANATDPSVAWSVAAGTGTATINSTGVLTGTGDGTVTVTATANDSSGKTGTLGITVTAAIPDNLDQELYLIYISSNPQITAEEYDVPYKDGMVLVVLAWGGTREGLNELTHKYELRHQTSIENRYMLWVKGIDLCKLSKEDKVLWIKVPFKEKE